MDYTFENYYIAARDPSRGGICIVDSKGSAKDFKPELNAIIDLVSFDYDTPCLAVYPMSNGSFTLSMAKKVTCSSKESRPHDIVRGIIVTNEELDSLCEIIARGRAEKLFFPGTLDPDEPENWTPGVFLGDDGCDTVKEFWDTRSYKYCVSFYKAILGIRPLKQKIKLNIRCDQRYAAMAIICQMMCQADIGLSIIVNGECPNASPDIAIIDDFKYSDSSIYKDYFFDDIRSLADSSKNEITVKEKKREELLDLCENYLTNDSVSEDELYNVLEVYKQEDNVSYINFIISLKRMLRIKKYTYENLQRFLTLLFICFKRPANVHSYSIEIEPAPYDFNGMMRLLRKVSYNKRELEALTAAMFGMFFDVSIGMETDRVLSKASKKLAKQYI